MYQVGSRVVRLENPQVKMGIARVFRKLHVQCERHVHQLTHKSVSHAHLLPMKEVLVYVAAIQAQNHLNPKAPIYLLPMEQMTKTDLVLHLRAYGEEPPRAWTKVELRQRLYDLEAAGEITIAKGGKQKTPYQEAVAKLNKASHRKAHLVSYVQENLNMTVGPNETIAMIQKRAMAQLMENIPGSGGDLMGYGKYADVTYEQVVKTDPQYVEWAKTTASEGPCSIYLDRFVNWVNTKTETPKKEPLMVTKNPKAKAATSGKIKVEHGPSPKPEKATESGSASSSTEKSVEILAKAVQELMHEVKEMKEERAASVPRKVAAKDVSM